MSLIIKKYIIPIAFLSITLIFQSAKCDEQQGVEKRLTEAQETFLKLLKDKQNLRDALDFIKSKLGTVYLNKNKFWDIFSVNINDNNWTWTETTTTIYPMTSVLTEQFSLNTKDLSIPTTTKDNSLTFECKQTKCIHVKKIYLSELNMKKPIMNEEDRADNTWWFKTESDAQRAANAMNFALEKLGASKSKY